MGIIQRLFKGIGVHRDADQEASVPLAEGCEAALCRIRVTGLASDHAIPSVMLGIGQTGMVIGNLPRRIDL